MSMTRPNINRLLEKVDSKYTLVMEASKRARQINDYRNASRRNELPMVHPPQVETNSGKALTIALEEIVADKVTYERLGDGIK